MTLMLGDRAFETSTTTGTGTINLAGPVSGFISLVAAAGNGSKVPYIMTQTNGSGVVTAWETGYGTVTSGSPDTLTRNPRRSSNANAAVNWGTGTRNVFLGMVADFTPFRDENMNFVEGFGAGGGTANAQTVTLPVAPLGYSDGMEITFFPSVSNTGAMTVNVNGLGTKSVKVNGADPASGFITTGTFTKLVYKAASGWFETILPAPVYVPPGAIMPFAMNRAPSGWLVCDGSAVSRTTYAALLAALIYSSTATITIASPGVVTWAAHGLSANDPVKFTTTGALPTGLVAGTTYYVVSASITTNTFQLSATPGGTAINTTGSQSGVHTAVNAPYGTGDGSTTFNVPDLRGEFVRGADLTRGVDASRSMGSAQTDAMQGHRHPIGSTIGGTTTSGNIYASNNSTAISGDPVTDGTNGTPRTAAETRPRNVAMMYCIKT